jgi:hypothetical protein
MSAFDCLVDRRMRLAIKKILIESASLSGTECLMSQRKRLESVFQSIIEEIAVAPAKVWQEEISLYDATERYSTHEE